MSFRRVDIISVTGRGFLSEILMRGSHAGSHVLA